MIVADTSAILAILLDEPESPAFLAVILDAADCCLSAANLLEARMALYGKAPANIPDLDQFLKQLRIQVEPVSETQSDIAFAAFCRFGKGTGHSAGLNFGDCFAYALARDMGCPLLFKGNDFSRTDITPAV